MKKRPRNGLLRTREFIMQDAYSFHQNYEDLDATYEDYRKAYMNLSLHVLALSLRVSSVMVEAKGGKDSQEFMAVDPERTDLTRWVKPFDQVNCFIGWDPRRCRKKSRKNWHHGWYLVKTQLPTSTESS